MKYKTNTSIQVTNVNYNHTNRQQPPRSLIKGMKGTIVKARVTENAYFVNLETGHQVYLYDDEIKLT